MEWKYDMFLFLFRTAKFLIKAKKGPIIIIDSLKSIHNKHNIPYGITKSILQLLTLFPIISSNEQAMNYSLLNRIFRAWKKE